MFSFDPEETLLEEQAFVVIDSKSSSSFDELSCDSM
jgi:hypothetical protein